MKRDEISKIKENREKIFGLSSLILFGIFLVIGIVFYVSLSTVKSGQNIGPGNGAVALSPENEKDFNFGLQEIIFSVVFGLFMTGFLLWTKAIIIKNLYLGVIIGITGSTIIGYAFYLKYRGPYSTGFMVVASLVILVYIVMNFFRYKRQEMNEDFE